MLALTEDTVVYHACEECSGLSVIFLILCEKLLCSVTSTVFPLSVPGSDAATSTNEGRRDDTLISRLMEDIQHLGATTEESKIPH